MDPKATEIQEKQQGGPVGTVEILRSTEAVTKEIMRGTKVATECTEVILRGPEVVDEDTGVIRCY